jgi:hypothetical protein
MKLSISDDFTTLRNELLAAVDEPNDPRFQKLASTTPKSAGRRDAVSDPIPDLKPKVFLIRRVLRESPGAACDLRASLSAACFASRAESAACNSAFGVFSVASSH